MYILKIVCIEYFLLFYIYNVFNKKKLIDYKLIIIKVEFNCCIYFMIKYVGVVF